MSDAPVLKQKTFGGQTHANGMYAVTMCANCDCLHFALSGSPIISPEGLSMAVLLTRTEAKTLALELLKHAQEGRVE